MFYLDEVGFSVLKYRENIPVLAECTACHLKFLTPVGMTEEQEAHYYLWKKYISHHCATATAQRKDGHRDNVFTLQAHTPRKQRTRAG